MQLHLRANAYKAQIISQNSQRTYHINHYTPFRTHIFTFPLWIMYCGMYCGIRWNGLLLVAFMYCSYFCYIDNKSRWLWLPGTAFTCQLHLLWVVCYNLQGMTHKTWPELCVLQYSFVEYQHHCLSSYTICKKCKTFWTSPFHIHGIS